MSNIQILNNKHLIIEGARLAFDRNFEGRTDSYNVSGDRYFNVVIDNDEAIEALEADGWNVKQWASKEDPENVTRFIKVKVSYRFNPPIVDLIGSRHTTSLDESNVARVDRTNFTNIDLEIAPSHWEMGGRQGVTGYLVAFYGTIEENYFAGKYSTGNDEAAPF